MARKQLDEAPERKGQFARFQTPEYAALTLPTYHSQITIPRLVKPTHDDHRWDDGMVGWEGPSSDATPSRRLVVPLPPVPLLLVLRTPLRPLPSSILSANLLGKLPLL